MDIRALDRLMRERPSVTAVHLRVDENQQDALFRDLKTLLRVSSVTVKEAAVQTFRDTMAETITIFVSFFIVFSCALAFGVTYNAARISLSERVRELATLRVLGFTRAEISYNSAREVALLTFRRAAPRLRARLCAGQPDRAGVQRRSSTRAAGGSRLDLRVGDVDRPRRHRGVGPARATAGGRLDADCRAEDPGVNG